MELGESKVRRIDRMNFFSYRSNITRHADPTLGILAGLLVGGLQARKKPKGKKLKSILKSALLGGLITTGAGAIHGTVKEAVGQHKLKKAGFKPDKHGYIYLEDKDGTTYRIHTNSMGNNFHYTSQRQKMPNKKMHTPGRFINRKLGIDVPGDYIEGDLINIDPSLVSYDKDKTRAVTLHEIGHMNDKSFKTYDDVLKYKKNTIPYEETADRFAIGHGVSKKFFRDTLHEMMEKKFPYMKLLVPDKDKRDKVYTKLDQTYRGKYLYED
jgi:hypothetical protein